MKYGQGSDTFSTLKCGTDQRNAWSKEQMYAKKPFARRFYRTPTYGILGSVTETEVQFFT